MKVKTKSLNEILTSFDPKKFLAFLESYENELRINPFINKHLNQRLKQKEIKYNEDTKKSLIFFEKNKEILKEIDIQDEKIRNEIAKYIIILNVIYKNLKEEIIDYSKKTKELEKIGIDNIIFGFNPLKRKTEPILVSQNLKTYIKTQNDKKIDSLRIFSNGIIKNSKLTVNKKNENKTVACIFDLKNPTFVLETSNNCINDLYLLGTDIDLETIRNIENLNQSDFEFNEKIENLLDSIDLNTYDYNLELNYPPLNGKNPKQLYK